MIPRFFKNSWCNDNDTDMSEAVMEGGGVVGGEDRMVVGYQRERKKNGGGHMAWYELYRISDISYSHVRELI